ncbi:DUF2953 domain-containing protein [Desulforamulus putei]|uniref:DUF2953 domain-containing protein n=1 Tax=Desulforamulus putei DSM 12395 TaxID=1121429 RepID=A0A1M4YEY9_9FIRM|nr:DUF2953 domain-containing protein [Desulforamulus putei]SHF04208.1 Protein of unknown function [Desulforamulus putei DSM 12395]
MEGVDQSLLTIIVLAGLVLLPALVFFSHIKVHLKYFRIQEDDTVSLEFFLWGLFHHKIEVPVLILRQKLSGFSLTTRTELETGGDDSREIMSRENQYTVESINQVIEKLREWLPWMQAIKEDIDYLLRHLVIERFHWRVSIGTPDAAATGMLAGLAWGLLGSLTSLFYRKIAPNGIKPKISVEPNFKKEGFSTSIDCIFKIRIGNIMVTGIKILKKKVNRRGVNILGRTSHRRPHENCHGKY